MDMYIVHVYTLAYTHGTPVVHRLCDLCGGFVLANKSFVPPVTCEWALRVC